MLVCEFFFIADAIVTAYHELSDKFEFVLFVQMKSVISFDS